MNVINSGTDHMVDSARHTVAGDRVNTTAAGTTHPGKAPVAANATASIAQAEPVGHHSGPTYAGAVHAGTWVVGLAAAAGATPELGDSHAEITAAYADHAARAITQAVMVHGLAAGALVVLGVALLTRARRDHDTASRFAGRAGVTAGVLAMVQLGLELLAITTADRAEPNATGNLHDLVQHLDGVKMFALAALAVATSIASHRTPLLRHWEAVIGYALAATITVSGAGYLLLYPPLAQAALLSLPLLLVWILLLGRALTHRP